MIFLLLLFLLSCEGLAYVTNPGYATPPAAVEYYYANRDAYRTAGTARTDFSLNYSYRIPGGNSVQPELFFHGEVINLFNQLQLCGCGGTVSQWRACPWNAATREALRPSPRRPAP